MKLNDKMLAAFLVSMGLFSVVQAQEYIGTLSNAQKLELLSVQQVAGTDTTPVDLPQIGGGTKADR